MTAALLLLTVLRVAMAGYKKFGTSCRSDQEKARGT